MSTDPQTMPPGYVPHSFATAREFLERLEERQSLLLAPYVARSMDSQHDARNNMDNLRESFEASGLPPEAVDQIDWETGAYMSAVAECITDLMHLAMKQGIQIQGCWAMGAEYYNRQSTALTRFMAYGAADEPERPSSLDVTR